VGTHPWVGKKLPKMERGAPVGLPKLWTRITSFRSRTLSPVGKEHPAKMGEVEDLGAPSLLTESIVPHKLGVSS